MGNLDRTHPLRRKRDGDQPRPSQSTLPTCESACYAYTWMDVLLWISLMCFSVLFVAALAIASHIRVGVARPPSREQERWKLVEHHEEETVASSSGRRPEQRVRSLVQHKEPDWRFLVSGEHRRSAPAEMIEPIVRKPPGRAVPDLPSQQDAEYSNKDLGDLTEPYRSFAPRAATGTGRAYRITKGLQA